MPSAPPATNAGDLILLPGAPPPPATPSPPTAAPSAPPALDAGDINSLPGTPSSPAVVAPVPGPLSPTLQPLPIVGVVGSSGATTPPPDDADPAQ